MKNKLPTIAALEFGQLASIIAQDHFTKKEGGFLSDKLASLYGDFKPTVFTKEDPIIPENTPTVQDLRQKFKAKVRVIEKRWVHRGCDSNVDLLPLSAIKEFNKQVNDKNSKFVILPYGGHQIVEITTELGGELRGESYCVPEQNFVRAYGRNLSIARALEGVTL